LGIISTDAVDVEGPKPGIFDSISNKNTWDE
jgi:hypothetical protein